MHKLVSVIVPCYNQAQYLPEVLQSVLDQSYLYWECIIVNDGSPDETEIISQKWVAKDSRFKYAYKNNGGLSSARNAGLEIATGDFVQFLDADDYLDYTKLTLSINAVIQNNEYDIVITNFRMFESSPIHSSIPYCTLTGDLFNFDDLLYKWEESFTIPIHCGLFKASLFHDFRFPEQLKAKEDWIMWIALYKNNCSTFFIDKPLALYRKNPHSMTQSMDMLGDFIKAYEYLKAHLSAVQYQKLTIVLLSRYYKSAGHFKGKLNEIKTTNTYFVGDFIKKSLRKLRLLKLCKCFLESTFNRK